MDEILDIEALAELDIDIEEETNIEVELEQAGPAGKDGKSAYDIYVENGGILTEIEWLNSLKGDPGKTPVLGEDYWTETDKNDIKTYCDNYIAEQIGIIENGEY